MKKEWITAVGVTAMSAALLCAGSIFAPVACHAQDTAQAEEVFEVAEPDTDAENLKASYNSNSALSGTFGDNNGLYWQYNASTKTVTVRGEDSYSIISTSWLFNTNAEHVVFQNCRMTTATFEYFFYYMENLKDIDFSGLEVGKITNINSMFEHCTSLEQLDLSWMNVSDITSYNSVFNGCSSLDYLDISSFDLNKDTLFALNVFDGCNSLKIIKTPKQIPAGITFDLPKFFDDENQSGTWYTSLYSANTGMTLKSRDCNGWSVKNGKYYWYEDGVRQGREGRGKEIYDRDSDAWYWLDAVQDGAKAVSKDVYQESSGGKWVRYDADGQMIKGWSDTDNGKYYFDPITGAMTKGVREIDGERWFFDETTGIAYDTTWIVDGDKYYWYEKGFKQGTEGRGKEIYDPNSDGWYWLDAVQGGAKAVSKDVYQESSGGKWVRYNADGHMVKGWQQTNAGTYYFDRITGAMAKGWTNVEGSTYYFDETTGLLQS